MNRQLSVLVVIMALLAAIVLHAPGTAMAALAGTDAGTTVQNNVYVDYEVGGIAQPQLSASASFNVDALVNFAVANITAPGVSNTPPPGGATQTYYLTFRVTNNGNVPMDFRLDTFQVAGDDYDQTIDDVYVDSNGNNVYDNGLDTALFIDELAPDLSNTVFAVAAAIPGGQGNGNIAGIIFNAVAFYNGTPGTLGPNPVQADTDGDNVGLVLGKDWELGDAGNNGWEGDTDYFQIAAAQLTVTKTSRVIYDPINGRLDAGNSPIAIPGGTISFTIEISAAAGYADAENVSVSDDLSGVTELIYNTGSILFNHPSLTTGYDGQTDGAPPGDYGEWTGTSVIVNGFTLYNGQTAQIVFEADIQ